MPESREINFMLKRGSVNIRLKDTRKFIQTPLLIYCSMKQRIGNSFKLLFKSKGYPDFWSISAYLSTMFESHDRYSKQTRASGLRVIPQDTIVLIDWRQEFFVGCLLNRTMTSENLSVPCQNNGNHQSSRLVALFIQPTRISIYRSPKSIKFNISVHNTSKKCLNKTRINKKRAPPGICSPAVTENTKTTDSGFGGPNCLKMYFLVQKKHWRHKNNENEFYRLNVLYRVLTFIETGRVTDTEVYG